MHYSDLGFDNYDEYISSEEWKTIRDMKYHSGDPYRCRVCWSGKLLSLHKRTYYNLTSDFFYWLLKHNRRIYNKILVWLCPRCNDLIHFYDGKKRKKKVPLDYLFLWDREQQIFYRPDMIIRRGVRIVGKVCQWFVDSYVIGKKKKRR